MCESDLGQPTPHCIHNKHINFDSKAFDSIIVIKVTPKVSELHQITHNKGQILV